VQDLNDMLFFAEVVERGGFAAAGRALGLPKSRLSRRVAELEGRLGVRLLHRTTRRLSLTDVGAQYLRHCVAVREEAEAAADVVALVHSEPRGTLRVSCPVTLAQTVVGELLPRFMGLYPLVRVEMQVSNRVVNLVEEGIDVALRVRPTLEDSGSLVIKPLGISQGLLVGSPAQLARQGHPATPQDLARLDTLSMAANDGRAAVRLFGPDGATHEWAHQPRFVADDLLTLKFAVLDGVGICVLPDYMCRDEIQAGRLVPVLPGWNPAPGRVHAVFASRRGLAPAVRRFLDFLGEHIGNSVPGGTSVISPPTAH
jgi:DNA-binding transcriptional LysR family regulator